MKKESKRLYRTILLSTSLIGLLVFQACNSDSGTDPQAVRINELTASWVLQSVTNDNGDVTNQFTGFQLSIDGLTYTTQNGGNAWPSNGTYEFEENNLDKILRSDGVRISIDDISPNALTLSFQVPEVTTGRVAGITGDFTFSLTK